MKITTVWGLIGVALIGFFSISLVLLQPSAQSAAHQNEDLWAVNEEKAALVLSKQFRDSWNKGDIGSAHSIAKGLIEFYPNSSQSQKAQKDFSEIEKRHKLWLSEKKWSYKKSELAGTPIVQAEVVSDSDSKAVFGFVYSPYPQHQSVYLHPNTPLPNCIPGCSIKISCANKATYMRVVVNNNNPGVYFFSDVATAMQLLRLKVPVEFQISDEHQYSFDLKGLKTP